MKNREIIKEYFDNLFNNGKMTFLYSDKRLLEKGDYDKLVEGQIKRAKTYA